MWSERLDLKPEKLDLRPERLDLGPEKLDMRGLVKGGTNGRTDVRTNKSPPVFYRTSSPSGPLPKKADSRL